MEHNGEHTKGGKESVLAKIRERQITMRSKFSFTFETFLAAFVALIILLISIALANFILFGLRINGHDALLGFGARGLTAFLVIFPWPLLILDILLIVFLERLLRRFKFGYRSPVLYLLLGLLVIASGISFAIDRATPVNNVLFTRARTGGLPAPIGEFYINARVPAPHDRGIYRGTVTEVGTSTFEMSHDDLDADTDDAHYIVILPPRFPVIDLSVGERVYVAGDLEGGEIRAFGIRKLVGPGETPPQLPSY